MHNTRVLACLLIATLTLPLADISPSYAMSNKKPEDPNKNCAQNIADQANTVLGALLDAKSQMEQLAQSCTVGASIEVSLECSASPQSPHQCELERKKHLADGIINSAKIWVDQQAKILGNPGCAGKLQGFDDTLENDYKPLIDAAYSAANGTISGGCGPAPAGIVDGTHVNTIGTVSPDGATTLP
jgi:hypothetical protein